MFPNMITIISTHHVFHLVAFFSEVMREKSLLGNANLFVPMTLLCVMCNNLCGCRNAFFFLSGSTFQQ